MPANAYSKSGAYRFAFKGMCTVCAPDNMPEGKVPLAINVHQYLEDAITPRLPQSSPLVTLAPSGIIHSLRRMNDNTGVIAAVPFGPDGAGAGADVNNPGSAAVWTNPGNITVADGQYASVTLTAPANNANVLGSPSQAINSWGGVPWANPQNVFVQDGNVATTGQLFGVNNVSQFLFAYGYGFAIPSNATILGFRVQAIVATNSPPNVADFRVQMLKAGVVTGANRANGVRWTSGLASQTYGGTNDLWGTNWTPADVNNPSFGIAYKCANYNSGQFSGTGSVDYISITVFYATYSNVFSDHLQGTSFGFAVPGGQTIGGIQVDIKGFQTAIPNGGLTVQLLKAGVAVGTAKTLVQLPPSNGFVSLGSSGDLWGTTWLPADVNAANFGLDIIANVAGTGTWNIDFIRITVFGFSGSPVTGYVFISGAGGSLYLGAGSIKTGFSGNRLALLPFRPNNSVQPWMYVGDSNQMVKVRSDGTVYKVGIAEPQVVPTLALSGAGPLTGTEFYAYSYRSSVTGAQSNLSPTSPIAGANSIVATNNNVQVTCTASTDPQVDLIDIWRFGVGLLSYTYVGTVFNSAPTFIDSLSDTIVANNQQATFDNFEPFPSIDVPKSGSLVVSAGTLTGTVTCTWSSGNQFNVRWLPGTIVTLGSGSGSTQVTLFARPTSATVFVGLIQPAGATLANGTYSFSIPLPNLAAQPLPAFWGPTDEAAYMFAVGDPLRPGTLYFTKGNNPDSAPQTNQKEITSPTEPLIGGAIVGGISLVFSSERGWLLYPNFAQAIATIIGVVGNPFTAVESITERGLFCKEGICTDGGGNLWFVTKDGIRQSAGGTGSESITDDIDNLFPHEGRVQVVYTIAGFTVQPPDYSNPNAMCLRFSQGYVYYDYFGLDGQYHTLKYDVAHKAWSVDIYGAIASVHADNEGQGTQGSPPFPAIGVLTGSIDGTIRNLSTAAIETNTLMTVLTPCYGGVIRSTKHYGDIYVENSYPFNNPIVSQFALTLWTDRYETQQPAGTLNPPTLPFAATPTYRQRQIVEINSGTGIFAQDLGLQITAQIVAPGLGDDGITPVYQALFLWEPTLIEQPETIGQRVTDWDDAGVPNAKLFQGVIVEADTAGAIKSFQVQSGDDLSLHDLAELGQGIAFTNQNRVAFSFAVPFIAHEVRLFPLETVPWRLFSLEWVYVPVPELCQEWHTEGTSHGLPGFQHVKEINVAHISTANVTLTLVPDTGPPQTVIVPSSAGVFTKTLAIIPAFKFKIVAYNFTSTAPFRLWHEDLEVKVGAWGRSDAYQTLKPFGGPSKAEAIV